MTGAPTQDTPQATHNLSDRLKAALARTRAKRPTAAAEPPTPDHPTHRRETLPATQPRKPDAHAARDEGGSDRPSVGPLLAPGSDAAIAAMMRRQSTRPEAIAMVSDGELVTIWRTMFGSAQAKGGVADRQAVFRALGLPFSTTGGSAKAGGPGGAGDFATRFEAASARVRQGRRRIPVTGDDPGEAETADFLRSSGDEHQSMELAVVPDEVLPPARPGATDARRLTARLARLVGEEG